MSKFQLVLTAVFGVFIVGGIIIFAAYRGSSSEKVSVTVWGTISPTTFSDILRSTALSENKLYTVQYVQRAEDEFDQAFVEALASDQGPDIFMLPSEKVLKHRNKIFPIPYDIFTQRQFKDLFIEGSEIYMAPEGVLGLPIYSDPLVMYWNRTMFTEAQQTQPPKYWDEFYSLASKMTVKDGALNIQKSGVALGELANISHAKELILNLAMQAGTPVTIWGRVTPQSVFIESFNKAFLPAEAAVNFFTEFSNPAKNSYSWNRSLSNSTNMFLGNNLAIYFGFASEIAGLQAKNPNLNFDVAVIPMSREGGSNVSFSLFNSLAITKASKNKSAAFAVASILVSKEGAKIISDTLDLPPARRDLLSEKQTSAFKSVFYESAIRSKSWLDPDPVSTDSIFRNMIESITSGRARSGEAVARANQELNALLAK
jgi:multiple sugar transport system substrate-binding protein